VRDSDVGVALVLSLLRALGMNSNRNLKNTLVTCSIELVVSILLGTPCRSAGYISQARRWMKKVGGDAMLIQGALVLRVTGQVIKELNLSQLLRGFYDKPKIRPKPLWQQLSDESNLVIPVMINPNTTLLYIQR
jgi:hypothetical protein